MRHSSLIASLTALLSIVVSVSNGQQEVSNVQQERVAGIKYVEPLNNRAGGDENDGDKYDCYRCNRFKGGGQACPETMRQVPGFTVPDDAPPADVIVRNCEICLKVKTTMWYRNRDYIVDKLRIQNVDHFESREVISRTCIEDKKDARLTSGCISEKSLGGTVERCYCQGHLCNSSPVTTVSGALSLTALSLAIMNMY